MCGRCQSGDMVSTTDLFEANNVLLEDSVYFVDDMDVSELVVEHEIGRSHYCEGVSRTEIDHSVSLILFPQVVISDDDSNSFAI